jgi:hypothetical protein
MILPERDILILTRILRYRYLTSDHIRRLFFPGKSKAASIHVLRRLSDLDFIAQKHFPRIAGNSYGNLLYLTDKGAKFLANELETTVEALGYRRIIYPVQSLNHFYHRKRMIDFWITLDEDIAKGQVILKTIATDTERANQDGKSLPKTRLESKDGKASIVPDIYFVLTNAEKTKERVFCVEIDTGKETIGGNFQTASYTLLDKYRTYETLIEDTGWKRQISTIAEVFEVLTITETTTHISGIQGKAKDALRFKKLFLFSTHELIEKHGILSEKNWLTLESMTGRGLLG